MKRQLWFLAGAFIAFGIIGSIIDTVSLAYFGLMMFGVLAFALSFVSMD